MCQQCISTIDERGGGRVNGLDFELFHKMVINEGASRGTKKLHHGPVHKCTLEEGAVFI